MKQDFTIWRNQILQNPRDILPLKFGMSQDEVIEIFGNPDAVSTMRSDGKPLILKYCDIELHFDRKDPHELYLVYSDDEIELSITAEHGEMLQPLTNTEPVDNEFFLRDGAVYFSGLYENGLLKGIAPKDFCCWHYWGKSSTACFLSGIRLRGADPASFRVLNYAYAMDKTAVYTTSGRIPDVELAAFQVLDNGQNDSGAPQGYAKDSRQVYFHNGDGKVKIIKGAEVSSFRSLGDTYFARDEKRIYPKIISLLDLTRDIMESYLIYLQTEAKERKNYRSDLYGLRRVIEDVGNHYDRQDIKNLFISTDFPSTPRYLFKFYSDETIKKLNENIFQMDEQIARALILHQLLGTRISDTLTLKTDCLSIRENRYFIRIEQVKSITFEKAISDEIAQLIIKSIDYTEEHYGKTKYIFVKKEDPLRPFQYSMLQHRVMQMIRKNDIRDENGELLNFGTHTFRHCYGKKLTEMHIDDWMIARLLGHKTLQSVHHYRKIGNKIMADETRAVREKIDMILMDVVKEWDGYEI